MTYRFKELAENKFHISVASTNECAMHGHDFLEFSYVKSGTIEHNIDGDISIVDSGEFFIVDYGTMHEYKSISDKPLVIINILFYPEFIDRTLTGYRSFKDVVNSYLIRFSYKTLKSSPTGKTFTDKDGKILKLVSELADEYKEKKYGYIEYIRCLFVQILITTMRKIGKSSKQTGKSDVIIEITEYIKNNYTDKIRLSDIAKKYNYSLSHISRKFKQEMGMGFEEYIQRIRIEHSCRMLESSDKKINEISSLCGYDNIKFFNKVFKNTLKITPREFKKLYK